MRKAVLFTAIVLVAVVLAWVIDFLSAAGQFKNLDPHFDGSCRQVEGLVGAEDITFHPNGEMAFVSAYDRRAVANHMDGKGAIYTYHLNTSELTRISPEIEDFRPHGISLHEATNGRLGLFVINHSADKHQVDRFDWDGAELTHVKTYSFSQYGLSERTWLPLDRNSST